MERLNYRPAISGFAGLERSQTFQPLPVAVLAAAKAIDEGGV